MSRIGKVPVQLVYGTRVEISNLNIKVFGPRGVIEKKFAGDIIIEQENNLLTVKPINNSKQARAMWGTARSIISSMVKGVSIGYSKELEINGVGYRASVQGKYLNLTLGKSHNTKVEIPEGIKVEALKQNVLVIESVDKEKLGEFIAIVKRQRKVEPYKGKGIKVKGEYIHRKEGKKS